jgi:hypothetical protein
VGAVKNIDIWRKAVPLDEVELEFVPQSLWRKYNRKHQINVKNRTETSNRISRQRRTDFIDVCEQLQESLAHLQRRSSVRSQMREWLMRELSDGRLSAYGYRLETPLAEEPVQIPSYMFVPKFANWINSSLKGFDQEFVLVRVLPTNEVVVEQKLIPSIPAADEPGPIGRPTHQKSIDAAIKSLEADGVDFTKRTGKENGDLVRRRITEQQTDQPTEGITGFGDETIRRRIANRQRGLKKL